MGNTPDPYTEQLGAIHLDGWADRSACIGKEEDLERTDTETPGRVLCFNCFVEDECRNWVLGLSPRQDPGGIRAGMNVMQRNRARRQRQAAARKKAAEASTVTKKPCRVCGVPKPVSEFYRSSRARDRDGLNPDCAACDREARRERRLRDADKATQREGAVV